MPTRRILIFFASAAVLCASAYGQEDSPSLGDVARQSRLQKQQKDAQSKDASAPAKDAATTADQNKVDQAKAAGAVATSKNASPKPSHVITNEEIPSHIGSTLTSAKGSHPASTPDEQSSSNDGDAAEQWKSQIQAQKGGIASLQSEIASLNDSIQYAGANCVSNCVQWNEEQKRKQDQVETMKAELVEQQKRLEDLQESARKQGFGSSVYDP
ncbi:MAG TPA: hypothetical protein VKF84_01960 [Candidatus Sulfotelmatobacter sp.]|nr:hypothetical protein [Candidatus Sulfotelmatobacter sp.]